MCAVMELGTSQFYRGPRLIRVKLHLCGNIPGTTHHSRLTGIQKIHQQSRGTFPLGNVGIHRSGGAQTQDPRRADRLVAMARGHAHSGPAGRAVQARREVGLLVIESGVVVVGQRGLCGAGRDAVVVAERRALSGKLPGGECGVDGDHHAVRVGCAACGCRERRGDGAPVGEGIPIEGGDAGHGCGWLSG